MQGENDSVEIHSGGEFHWVGNGFPVRSVFGYNDLGQKISPFLLLDYAAPYEFLPGNERRGVGGHPHRGFETVTIAYQGEIEHRDSSGGGGIIGPGDVQWMTAASGLVHEEFHSSRFTKAGGTFEMVQLWVNLPAKYKNADPKYQTILDRTIPRVKLAGEQGESRIIAGEFDGVKGPAKTFTPLNMWDMELRPNASISLEMPVGHNRAILVLRGELTIQKKEIKQGELATIDQGLNTVNLTTETRAKLLVLTGEPVDEKIVGYGPFVMNTKAEIQKAFEDFQMGKFGTLE